MRPYKVRRSKIDNLGLYAARNIKRGAKIIEYKEALIFSFIGLLRVLGINNCYSSVTGAKKDHCSGKIYKP